MITPTEITTSIIDAAFAEGQNAAQVIYRYWPGELTPELLEDVQDRVVLVVSQPFEVAPHFRSEALLNGIKVSVWSGFERRWREMVHEDLGRPRFQK